MTAELHDEVLLLTTFAAHPTSALVNSAAAAGKRSHSFVDSPTTDDGDDRSESGAAPGSDPHMEDEKRLKRMRRNRESAALSRSRKKAYVEELETKVEELQGALQALQAENARLLHERARQSALTAVQPPAATADVGPTPTAPAQEDAHQRGQHIDEESDSRNPRPALSSPLADSPLQNAARTPQARSLQPPPRSPSRTSCCELLLQFSTSSAPQPQPQPPSPPPQPQPQPQPQLYSSSAATANNHDTCTAMKVC